MKRWQLTLGLTGAAIAAAALAPRLTALLTPIIPVTPEAIPPIAPEIIEVVEAIVPAEQGRLIVDAGLDRGAVLKGTASERFLTITVRAPVGEGEQVRRPANVAVVLDSSGSMSARGKIDYAKRAAKALVDRMDPVDAYSLVIFNDDASVIVPATQVTDPARLLRQIDRVSEGGGTNLYAGMRLGTQQIEGVLDAGEVGRMVILSDGKANVGVTDPDSLARLAANASAKGITVSVLGLGIEYNEDLLARIADLGGGTYAYIDDPGELEQIFTRELQQTTTVVARNTAVTIELPPGVEPIEVIGWDAKPVGHGWQIFMGDVYAGAERKIVARVRVTGSATGDLQVANVRADYTDMVDNAPSVSSDIAMAEITVDPNRVEASLNTGRAAAANAAWGNQYLEMSTRAYERGDMPTAKKMLRQGSAVLRDAASSLGSGKLDEDASNLDLQLEVYTTNTPSSDNGRRAIKMNKEYFRDAAR